MTVEPSTPSRSAFPPLASKIAIGTLDICGAGARALLSLSAAAEDGSGGPRLQRTVHAVDLQSLKTSAAASASSRAFPPEPSASSSSSSAVVVVNFSEAGCSSSAPVASLVVVQAPVGDASAAAVAAELARGIAEGVAASDPPSVLLLAALRLPNAGAASPSTKNKSSPVVFLGGDRGAFSFPESISSKESLPRQARISDGFVAALALSLSLSLVPSSKIALAAVDGHRPPVVPLFGSSSSASSAAAAAAAAAASSYDSEALEAASALGEEAAAEFLGGSVRFSVAKAARLVPSRAALLKAAALTSASAAAGVKSTNSTAAPPVPLLQGAEQMYG